MVVAKLYELNGRLLDKVAMPFQDNSLECYFSFDIQKLSLPSGVYLIKLKSKQEEYVQKIVVNK